MRANAALLKGLCAAAAVGALLAFGVGAEAQGTKKPHAVVNMLLPGFYD